LDISKGYLKKSIITIIIFMGCLTAVIDSVLYIGIDSLCSDIRLLSNNIPALADQINRIQLLFSFWFIPLSSVFFVLSGFVLWLVLKFFLRRSLELSSQSSLTRTNKDFADKRLEQEQKHRLFLHMLSILQREGRLLDFFNEDLNDYDDEQIGMAVRSIQEDCKKAVHKYIALKPVYDRKEGDMIEINADFDPDSVKLIGNVSGEPPFKGVLKHRGWKAGKKEIPKLSTIKNSAIITPAEVEIK
jgi:hypothetical protein